MAQIFTIKLPADIEDGYVTADWHLGDLFLHDKAPSNCVNYINRNPPGLNFIPGDLCRYFTIEERHMCFEEIEKSRFPTPASQMNEAERILSEIDHKPEWSFISKGNHEDKLFKKAGNYYYDHLGEGICKRQGYTYADIESWYHLKWDDGTDMRILVTHGTRLGINPHLKGALPGMGWRQFGNARQWLRNGLARIDNGGSDLYLKGHEHRAYYYEPYVHNQLTAEGDDWSLQPATEAFVNKPVWAACTGGFGKTRVKGTVTYQEEASYGAADIAMLHIKFEKQSKKRIPKIEIVDLS